MAMGSRRRRASPPGSAGGRGSKVSGRKFVGAMLMLLALPLQRQVRLHPKTPMRNNSSFED